MTNKFDYACNLCEDSRFVSIASYENYNTFELADEIKKEFNCNFDFAIHQSNTHLTLYKKHFGLASFTFEELEKNYSIDCEDIAWSFEESIVKLINEFNEFIVEDNDYYKVQYNI